MTGDCEDTSALLISLVEILGYNASIILIPEAWDGYGHAAVGINVTGASGVHSIKSPVTLYFPPLIRGLLCFGDSSKSFRSSPEMSYCLRMGGKTNSQGLQRFSTVISLHACLLFVY